MPLVSVIVPCYREAAHIEACLRSILAQETPEGGFEVLVVDGMSEDGTREIIQKIAGEDPRVRLLDNPQRFQSFAMNLGIRAALGQIVIRNNAHTEYAPNYIAQCIRVLEETKGDNVGGPHLAKGDTYLQRGIAAAHHSPFAVGGALSHNLSYEGHVDTVIYGCWYKDTLLNIGLFDEGLVRNQDDELNFRLIQAGGKIWQSPSIKSWYQPRSSLSGLFRQYFQYGYWKVRVIQKHGRPASWRHFAPGLFVAALLGNLAMLPLFSRAALPLSILIIVYLGISLASSVLAAKEAGWSLLPVMPVIFACYHIGYGLGFLRGLLDFMILRRQPPDYLKNPTR